MVTLSEEKSANVNSRRQETKNIPSSSVSTTKYESLINSFYEPQSTPSDSEMAWECHLPAFNRENPDLWFAQVEACFYIYGVWSDRLRNSMVIHKLDEKTIQEMRDVLTKNLASRKYETLKAVIIKKLTENANIKLKEQRPQVQGSNTDSDQDSKSSASLLSKTSDKNDTGVTFMVNDSLEFWLEGTEIMIEVKNQDQVKRITHSSNRVEPWSSQSIDKVIIKDESSNTKKHNIFFDPKQIFRDYTYNILFLLILFALFMFTIMLLNNIVSKLQYSVKENHVTV